MRKRLKLYRRISKAIKFWYLTEDDDIRNATRSDLMDHEALKAKYAKLRTKIKDPQNAKV